MTDNAILEERARRLAVPAAVTDAGAGAEVLCFTLAGERYAIETRFIRRVVAVVDATPVPEVPRYFAGVANVEGEIVPLVDLGLLLNAATERTDGTHAVLLGRDHVELGILAGSVENVEHVHDGAHADRDGSGPVLRVLGDARIVLDGAALLDDPRLTLDRTTTTHDQPEETHE